MIDAIKTRRSVKAYTDRPVSKELIEEILEAGRYAPSSLNAQPWEFAVVTDRSFIKEMTDSITKAMKRIYSLTPVLRWVSKELRDERSLAAVKKTATSAEDTVFYKAPVVIFIVSQAKGLNAGINCALSAQNMMLAAHSLGLGSCFIGRGNFLQRNKKFRKKIGLSKNHKIYATLIFGYPKDANQHVPQRKRDNVICWLS